MSTLRGDSLQPLWLFFMDTAPAVRLLFNGQAFKLGPSGPDAAGGFYLGAGRLMSMPPLTIPLNGAFSQHTFGMSGLDAATAAAIAASGSAIRGALVAIARLELNDDQTPDGDPQWLWQGVCDGPFRTRNGRVQPVTYSAGVKASSGSASRRRHKISLYTPSQQALRDPDDTAMSLVPTLADGTTRVWPVP